MPLNEESNDLVFRTRPPRDRPQGALVLFHGRGADEHDLYPLLDMLDPKQNLLGACPRGPLTFSGMPGAHWYIVRRVGYPDPDTFFATFARTQAWLDNFLESNSIPPERLILGGFSQGSVMAYALGLAGSRPAPAGIIALSGFIPHLEGFELDLSRRQTRIAIGHGSLDPVIEVGWGRDARDRLEEAGFDVTYQEAPLPHLVDPAFVESLGGWIRDSLKTADRSTR